jgi:phage-related minor tail protein
MGEAGAEAIMPLTRGSDGRLGVQAQGAGIGGVAVTVNIQQGGAASTEVSSEQQNALGSQLGREIGVVVQREISNQMRPGGLLWKWQKGRV